MDKMNLCIDIGNTSTKAALFQNGEEIAYFKPFTVLDYKQLQKEHAPTILVCKTGKYMELEECLLHDAGPEVFLSHLTQIPLLLDYHTPQTLGRDRIATAVAAGALDEEAAWLIVDLGTCLTIDLVVNGTFKGGLISPGVQMRLKAMHEFTLGLPLVDYDYSIQFPGKSTEESMQVGVCQSIGYEIEGYLRKMSTQFDRLNVVDSSSIRLHFAKELKNKIFARPKLVLEGLNHIIEYNAKK
jgi:type III pantothenate kinase